MERQAIVNLIQRYFLRNEITRDGIKMFSTTNKHRSSKEAMAKEKKYSAPNYEPLPLVIAKGEGCKVWDPEGKMYLDFLSGIGTLQIGHCHPKLVKVLSEQGSTLTHVSRAYYNNVFPEFAEKACELFQYEKIIPMNTGVEAGETALKIARRWGYTQKKVPQGKAKVLFPEGNFWGRTTSAISTAINPTYYENFGPIMPGLNLVPYNDLDALKKSLEDPNVVAYFMEPILGEGGVVIPSENYLKEVRKLCTDHNVLWIADEVQTGLGRTGKLYACQHENVKPDILLLGKGLAGGFMPMSAALSSEEIMSIMTSGSHGSTFGGNPLACKLGIVTLDVIQEEGLVENARIMGEKFRSLLNECLPKEVVIQIRGRGLMNAIVINKDYIKGWDLCIKLIEAGLLAKNSDDSTVRFLPPLTVNENEIKQAVNIIENVLKSLKKC